jgi:hypothetical protein
MKTKNLITYCAIFLVVAFCFFGCKNVSKPTISTSMGILSIDSVKNTVIDPFTNNTAPDGYKYLSIAISLKSAESRISEKEIEDFKQISKDVTVIGDDGSKPIMFVNGLSKGQLFLSYLIKATSQKYTLNWLDNPPIELNISK